MSTKNETLLCDIENIHHSFLQTLVCMKEFWWGLHATLGHDESGHSSTSKNMENEEFPKKIA
jgi:hypothetical protein